MPLQGPDLAEIAMAAEGRRCIGPNGSAGPPSWAEGRQFHLQGNLDDHSITRRHAVMTFDPRPENQGPGYKATESE
jgi:hypothetical protein